MMHRVREEQELDALFLGVLDLLHSGRHLLLRAAVDEVDVLRAEPSAVRAESIATFPPPKTATFFARGIGVSDLGNG